MGKWYPKKQEWDRKKNIDSVVAENSLNQVKGINLGI